MVVGVVKTVQEAVRQPQVLARGLTAPVDDPIMGRIDIINSAVKFAGAAVGVRSHAPTLGEHNETVLRDLLGYDEQRMLALHDAGVLRQEAI